MRTRPLRRVTTVLALAAVLTPMIAAQPAWAQTLRDKQWYLTTLNIAAAHQLTKGSGVVVAVVDSGVSLHTDLVGQVLDTGHSFIGPENQTQDEFGHGTEMAGMIAAKGGDSSHLLGIAPEAKILPVKVGSTQQALGGTFLIRDGIRWAVDHGAKVINVSMGYKQRPDNKRAEIDYALSKDVVVVACTGNVGTTHPEATGVEEPAALPGLLAIINTDRNGVRADTGVTGPEVVLAAPGVDVPALKPALVGAPESYITGTGTSFAAALVSGAAALIRSKYPTMSANDVINRLIKTADDRGTPGRGLGIRVRAAEPDEGAHR